MRYLVCIFCAVGVLGGSIAAQAQLSADFQRGVNHAHIHRGDRGYGSPVSAKELAELKTIGVTHIAITPFGYQRGFDADTIALGNRDRSLTDEHLLAEVRHAHALGMAVTLKPHIWSNDFGRGDQWHGTIDQTTPQTHARWWSDYRQLALHYARLAQQGGIEQYCIGTELVKMTTQYPQEWRELIADIRKVYDGRLTYAAHWYEEWQQIAFWDALDSIGIAAYFPLDAPVGADVDQLAQAWSPHKRQLEAMHQRTGLPIVFMEVGYRPVADCHMEPWRHGGGKVSEAAQARAFEAMFAALGGEPWWRGAYIWKTFTDPTRSHSHADGPGFAFRGSPAQTVLRRWYGRQGASSSGQEPPRAASVR
jgi:hypothetical protein